MKRYKWYACDAQQGVAQNYEEACAELQKRVSFDLDEADVGISPDGATTYFYEDEEAFLADRDGAYCPSITEVPGEE